ncbi:GNAT family N-acetyltransferase [uncultured Alistipes sp.]|uniref:GNAT family N-acetyltransferase n=1 Tax=uncultured Alistipes sp. TaxID=538949 RepID=UPI0026264C13|nr:GNAT family N-acetyltransferase [uncultured Alistipes sp.]
MTREAWRESRGVSLLRASESDIPLLRRLAGEAFPATYREILTPAQLDYMMAWMYSEESLRGQFRDGHVFYLAFRHGIPCGYVSVERQGERLFHLQKIYVLPGCQGSGVGRALFLRAVDHVRANCPGACRMELNVNRSNRALHFYERMGMQRLREGDFPIGEGFYMNDYIMGLDLE